MKLPLRWTASLALVLAAIGCEKTTVEGSGGKKLTLMQPANQSLKRGETNDVSITVTRTNFQETVKVAFDNLPKGVSVVEDKGIPGDKNMMSYTLHAKPDADLVTDHQVNVTVTGPDGMKATETFKITVKDKS